MYCLKHIAFLYGIYQFKQKGCVSEKNKDLQETQSAHQLSLLTASGATSRQEYCENAFMPLQKDVRKTDAKMSLSLTLFCESRFMVLTLT